MNFASELDIKYFMLASKPAKAFCLLRYVELPFTTFVESYSGTICFSLSSGETLSNSSMINIKRKLEENPNTQFDLLIGEEPGKSEFSHLKIPKN